MQPVPTVRKVSTRSTVGRGNPETPKRTMWVHPDGSPVHAHTISFGVSGFPRCCPFHRADSPIAPTTQYQSDAVPRSDLTLGPQIALLVGSRTPAPLSSPLSARLTHCGRSPGQPRRGSPDTLWRSRRTLTVAYRASPRRILAGTVERHIVDSRGVRRLGRHHPALLSVSPTLE